jgi:hypothetical protein
MTISHSTIAHNAVLGEGGFGGGGIYAYGYQKFFIRSSILALNTSEEIKPPDCSGSVNSLGHNLLGDNTGCNFDHHLYDQVGDEAHPINPLIGPLGDNGGETWTLALLSGSPAIDTGTCTDGDGQQVTSDQRDYLRPWDGDEDGWADCDIGAYEYNSTPPPAALSLRAYPTTIPPDGVSTSTLTATLISAEGELVPRHVVHFTTNLGSLSSVTATSDLSGQAVVSLQSVHSIEPQTAIITATLEDLRDNVDVIFKWFRLWLPQVYNPPKRP